jgi:hypothetical protein
MRNRTAVLVAALLAAIVAAVSGSMAAPTAYQFTGKVVEFDARARTITVDKGGEAWEFSTEGLKNLRVKKGEQVTVSYRMVAKKVEPK